MIPTIDELKAGRTLAEIQGFTEETGRRGGVARGAGGRRAATWRWPAGSWRGSW